MSDGFDPYYEWLGIPPKDQPPNHYRLLGIELFEQNLNVIERAADRQMGHVRSYQTGKHGKESQRLLNELSSAKVCLLSSQKKSDYDQQLRALLASRSQPDPGLPTDGSIPELPPGVPEGETVPVATQTPFVPAGPEIEIRHVRKESARKETVHSSSRSHHPPVKWRRLVVAGAIVIVLVGGLGTFAFMKLGSGGSDGASSSGIKDPNTAQNGSTASQTDPSSETKTNDSSAGGKKAVGTQSPPVVATMANVSRLTVINESVTQTADTPLLPASPQVPKAVRDAITASAGLVNNQFAYCQTLLWTQLDETNRALRAQGYRISRCRPYLAEGDWRVAAIWLRDGLPSRVVGLTDSTTLLQADQRLRKQGFMPVDVVGGADGKLELFVAVWVRPKTPVGASALTLGVAAHEYETSKERMLQQGYRSTVHLTYFDSTGKGKYCDLWIKPPVERPDSLWSGDKGLASIQLERDAIQTDVGVTSNPKDGGVLFSGTQWLDAKDVVKPFVGISPYALRDAALQQVNAGYLPASLSVAAAANGELVSVSLWRPAGQLQTPLELASLEPGTSATPTATTPPTTPPPTPTSTATGRALRLAGKSSIELRDTPGLANVSQDFTVETWLRFDEQAFGAVNILCGTAAYRGLHPEVTTMSMKGWLAGIKPARTGSTTKSQFIFQWAAANGQTQNHTADIMAFDDKWHHLALCNRGSNAGWELVVYVDGQESLRKTHSDTKDAASPVGFYLGRPQWIAAARRSLHGLIRAFRLSSGVRYQQSFQPETQWKSDAQTIALLDFSGSSPGEVPDLSGKRRPAVIVGAIWSDLDGNPLNNAASLADTSPSVNPGLEKLKPPANYEAETAKVREVFKAEIAAAKDPLALAALGEKLLTQAADEQDPALQYALYCEARRLAVEGIDWNIAARTIEELTTRYQVDPWVLRAEVLGGLAKKAKVPADRKILADKAVAQAETALAEGVVEVVDSLLSSASNLAPRGERELVREIGDLRKRLTEEKKVQQLVRDARTKLADSPSDPMANESLGKYLCFTKEDWETGIRHLAKGPDGKLASVARSDQKEPTGAVDRVAVADAWYDFAKTSTDATIKGGAANRALHWYQLALPDLSGVKKAQAEKQIDELSKSATSPRGKAKFAWLDGEPGVAVELRGHTGEVTSLAVTRFGRFLISGSIDDTVRIWELSTGKPAGQISSGTGDVNSLLLSPDDRTVAIPVAASGEYSIGILNLQNRQPVGSIQADGMARQLAGSQDWRRVVYAKNQAGQNNLLIYNLAAMAPVAPLSCPGTPVQVAVSRTGRFLAAADDNNVVYVWDMQTGKAVLPLTGHNEAVTCLAFSPNERQLVSCGYRSVIVWDLIKGVEEHRIPTQDTGAAVLTFSPDGSRLLVSGTTMEVSVYNAQAGTLAAQVRAPAASGSNSTTRALVSFADGRAAATAGADGLIRIYRLPP